MHFSKKHFFFLVSIIALIMAVWYSGIAKHFNYVTIRHDAHVLKHVASNHKILSFFISIGLFIFITFCALPFASAIMLTAGYLFGAKWGFFYANLGATLGAAISFLLVRYGIGEYVNTRFISKFERFNHITEHDSWPYFLMIRIVPLVPYFVTNILAGITKVRMFTFLWTTALGLVPSTLLLSFAGQELTGIHSLKDVLGSHLLFAFLGLATLSSLPLIIRVATQKRNYEE
jgi:uncharacterized membrane protein YdjX (TVP38/TMEM64 family)